MLTIQPKFIPIRDNNRVLDLGCGEGRHLCGLLDTQLDIELVGIDLNINDLIHTHEKLNTWYKAHQHRCLLSQTNGLQLPFADNSFDHIICSEVLEHIHDYKSVLSEIKRVLKPQGYLCVSVPRAWPEKICWKLSSDYHQVEGGHVRIFDSHKLQAEIAALGFQIFKQHWAHALHSPYWWLKCFFWKNKHENVLLRSYHKLLVWDLMKKPLVTKLLEKALNPLMGKSTVMYFENHQA